MKPRGGTGFSFCECFEAHGERPPPGLILQAGLFCRALPQSPAVPEAHASRKSPLQGRVGHLSPFLIKRALLGRMQRKASRLSPLIRQPAAATFPPRGKAFWRVPAPIHRRKPDLLERFAITRAARDRAKKCGVWFVGRRFAPTPFHKSFAGF